MKVFRMQSDVLLEANSVDDAFLRISKYFKSLSKEGLNTNSIFEEGTITIEGAKDERNN